MRLLLIRHGKSEADLLDVHEGRADFCLTEKGCRQAKKMADWVVSNYTINRIYSSPLKRAYQTAKYLSDTAGIEIEYKDNLLEFNNGLIAGLKRNEAILKFPPVSNLPIHKAMYEMESALEFRYRADYILSEIIHENDANSTLAVISHGGTINQLLHSFLQMPIESDITFSTGDTGIHCLYVESKSKRILYMNNTEHLTNDD